MWSSSHNGSVVYWESYPNDNYALLKSPMQDTVEKNNRVCKIEGAEFHCEHVECVHLIFGSSWHPCSVPQ